ncbi:hypothetical protein MTO96_033298 [Rhipicephalus appendiculatus]
MAARTTLKVACYELGNTAAANLAVASSYIRGAGGVPLRTMTHWKVYVKYSRDVIEVVEFVRRRGKLFASATWMGREEARGELETALYTLFLQKQAVMVDSLADLQVDLTGDGRCDSPGYSAKYLTYSVLAMQNGCILHSEQVQVGESPEVTNSVSMEKRGLAKCLTALENLGINISSLTTDRHPGVKLYCRKYKPNMPHWYDVWHFGEASPAFHQLKTIVDNPLLLRDIRRLSSEVQTFLLKSFHSVLNCFAPKSNAFSEDSMQARTWLAVLYFNENAGPQQALTREGEERWKMKSSKARRGHFTVAAVKEEPSYGRCTYGTNGGGAGYGDKLRFGCSSPSEAACGDWPWLQESTALLRRSAEAVERATSAQEAILRELRGGRSTQGTF